MLRFHRIAGAPNAFGLRCSAASVWCEACMTKPRNRFRWSTATACALLLLGSATMIWGAATYVRLVRLRVEVTDACSRIEATSRSRVELVAGLIESANAFA